MTTTTTQLSDGGRVERTEDSDGTWEQRTYDDAGEHVSTAYGTSTPEASYGE